MSLNGARRPSEVRAEELRENTVCGAKKAAKGKVSIGGKKVNGYKMPKTRKGFLLDVEIGKMIANRGDALTADKIMGKFGITKKQLEKRAELLKGLVKAGQVQWIKSLLYEAGRVTRPRE